MLRNKGFAFAAVAGYTLWMMWFNFKKIIFVKLIIVMPLIQVIFKKVIKIWR